MSYSEREGPVDRLGRFVQRVLGSVFREYNNHDVRTRCWFLFLVIIGLIYLVDRCQPELAPIHNAEPFQWPQGCKPYDIANPKPVHLNFGVVLKSVPCECFRENYLISDSRARGLQSSRKWIEGFYRLENDAVEVSVRGSRPNFICSIGKIYENFFIAPNGRELP